MNTKEKLELESRAELDNLKLEVKAIQLYLEFLNPDFKKVFNGFREKVFHEINPEAGKV